MIPILLILLLGTLQFIFIYEAKMALNYATFIATRQGALKNGKMDEIESALYSGLTPLFSHGKDLQALKDARALAKLELGNNHLAKVSIVNPTPGAYSGFANSDGEIPNDNLMYRDPANYSDSMNVQDANLLKVRVTYCVRLVVPIVNRMIYSMVVNPASTPAKIDSAAYQGTSIAAAELLKTATPGSATGPCIEPTNAYPYRIPVTSEAVVRMQSSFQDPVRWVSPAGTWTTAP